MTIETLSIEDLVQMRNQLLEVLADKVQARQRELSDEAERLSALVTGQAKPKPEAEVSEGNLSWSGRGTQPGWVETHLA